MADRAVGEQRCWVPAISGVFELFDRCDRVLVMTSRSFDFVPDELPRNVRYTGPQLDDPAWALSEGPGVDWRPVGDGPLVLVAMSSVFQDQFEVLRRAARALGIMPVRGVITTGRAVDPGEVPAPGNVRVLRAVPHALILPEAAVVITHAGHGTVIKAWPRGATGLPPAGSRSEGQRGPGAAVGRRDTPRQAGNFGRNRECRPSGARQ